MTYQHVSYIEFGHMIMAEIVPIRGALFSVPRRSDLLIVDQPRAATSTQLSSSILPLKLNPAPRMPVVAGPGGPAGPSTIDKSMLFALTPSVINQIGIS